MSSDEYKWSANQGNESSGTPESILALHFADSLRRKGVLDDIICAEDVDCVRTCERCGKLMDAGWVYEGIETYCSDDCLIASHPEIDIKELKTHTVEDNSNSYWTNWEK